MFLELIQVNIDEQVIEKTQISHSRVRDVVIVKATPSTTLKKVALFDD